MLLKETVVERGFKFDCYDLIGPPNDPEQTYAVAKCAAKVIGRIQKGTDSAYQLCSYHCMIEGKGGGKNEKRGNEKR